jgi:hypothetical protein
MDWNKVNFCVSMKEGLKDFKNPVHDSGEPLIIFYAKYEC